jgi:hypothetical protein
MATAIELSRGVYTLTESSAFRRGPMLRERESPAAGAHLKAEGRVSSGA